MPPKKKQKRMPAATDKQPRSRSPESESGSVADSQEAIGGEARQEAVMEATRKNTGGYTGGYYEGYTEGYYCDGYTGSCRVEQKDIWCV